MSVVARGPEQTVSYAGIAPIEVAVDRGPRTALPLKAADVDALIAGYRAGRTMQVLTAELGIDRRTVSGYLRRAEVPARRGGLDDEEILAAGLLYEAGWSSGQLARGST